MTDERLYIDGQLVDIDENTKITLNVKSNLFQDVSKIVSNSTYTVKLPKTVRNQMLLRHSDLVQSNDSYAYKMHAARYFRNGVEVIKDGRATILQVTDEAIELSIIWGLYPNFSALVSNGTTLNQLESNDRILYQSKNVVDTYEDAKTKNYFYANYDVWKHDDTVDYTWKSGEGMTYPEDNGRGSTTTITFGGFGGARSEAGSGGVENLHPVVRVPFILSLIKSQTGIEFSFTEEAKDYIDTLVVPLINRKSNELTFDGKFKANMATRSTTGAVSLNIIEASNVFTQTSGSVTTLTAASDANVIIDLSGEWSFDLTGATPNGHSTYTANGVSKTYDNYSFKSGYYLKMTVHGDEDTEYIMGSSGRMMVSVPSGYQGVVKYKYTGYGKIVVKTGNTITFEWLSNTSLKSASFLGGTLQATLSSDDNVPSGCYFPICYNLPQIKIIDFVKFLAAITGTFPLQMSGDNTVIFVPLSTVWENRSEAKDWTRRVIAQASENKPKSIEFTMSDYGQHNRYVWKEDDTVVGNYDGDMQIDNDTLDTEKTVFEFPFAATDGNNVPMYEKASTSSSGGTFGGSSSGDTTTTTTTTDTEPSYSACKDRILRVVEDSNGKAQALFDINMQEIIDEKYKNVSQSLQRAKIVTEKVRIRDLELINFDETKPIYLAQYASYFAVTEIKAEDTGTADVTMLQLYFDDEL